MLSFLSDFLGELKLFYCKLGKQMASSFVELNLSR